MFAHFSQQARLLLLDLVNKRCPILREASQERLSLRRSPSIRLNEGSPRKPLDALGGDDDRSVHIDEVLSYQGIGRGKRRHFHNFAKDSSNLAQNGEDKAKYQRSRSRRCSCGQAPRPRIVAAKATGRPCRAGSRTGRDHWRFLRRSCGGSFKRPRVSSVAALHRARTFTPATSASPIARQLVRGIHISRIETVRLAQFHRRFNSTRLSLHPLPLASVAAARLWRSGPFQLHDESRSVDGEIKNQRAEVAQRRNSSTVP